MPRAVIVHRSRSGTTRRYAEAIGEVLRSKGLETQVVSVADVDIASLPGVDLLLLGCWTNGLFVIRQHPDEPWNAFVRELPPLPGTTVGLFTTYRLATGSMFARMRERLPAGVPPPALELRSRDGGVSEADRTALQRLVAGLRPGVGPAAG